MSNKSKNFKIILSWTDKKCIVKTGKLKCMHVIYFIILEHHGVNHVV